MNKFESPKSFNTDSVDKVESKTIDTKPDNLIYDENVKEFKNNVSKAIKEKGPLFFKEYEEIITRIKGELAENDLKKSPYYHALIGSSGIGKNSLEFNTNTDEMIKNIFNQKFNSKN